MTIQRTDPTLVSDVRVTDQPIHRSASGYGAKIPTRWTLAYDGRRRRVYVMQYANSGSADIVVGGEDLFLDNDTEHALEDVAS